MRVAILILYLFLNSCQQNKIRADLNAASNTNNGTHKEIELMQGNWLHELDSSASLSIHKNRWTFNYAGEESDSDDTYSITIKDKLPEFVRETEKAQFIILTNRSDTMQFEILGLTDSTFSMMHFPTGRIHLYWRKK